MKSIKLDATIENLTEVLLFIDKQLMSENVGIRTKMAIDVAVEELYVNIARYAYAPNVGEAEIIVDAQDNPKACEITFIDSGIPYDPLKKEDPDVNLPAEERQIGGLGIFMVKKSMDDMRYEYKDNKNILTIRKVL
jgi:anti-sigma regulatory factor (Ser/Thr protein kinase)